MFSFLVVGIGIRWFFDILFVMEDNFNEVEVFDGKENVFLNFFLCEFMVFGEFFELVE